MEVWLVYKWLANFLQQFDVLRFKQANIEHFPETMVVIVGSSIQKMAGNCAKCSHQTERQLQCKWKKKQWHKTHSHIQCNWIPVCRKSATCERVLGIVSAFQAFSIFIKLCNLNFSFIFYEDYRNTFQKKWILLAIECNMISEMEWI